MVSAQPPAPAPLPSYRDAIRCDAQGVRDGLLRLRRAFAPCDLLEEERGAMELVLAEVINNVVEHAFAGCPGGVIRLVLHPAPGGLRCEVRDHGAPMPGGQVPEGLLAQPARRAEDLPEGGFGWFLIGSLAHDLAYRRAAGENILSFRMRIGAAG